MFLFYSILVVVVAREKNTKTILSRWRTRQRAREQLIFRRWKIWFYYFAVFFVSNAVTFPRKIIIKQFPPDIGGRAHMCVCAPRSTQTRGNFSRDLAVNLCRANSALSRRLPSICVDAPRIRAYEPRWNVKRALTSWCRNSFSEFCANKINEEFFGGHCSGIGCVQCSYWKTTAILQPNFGKRAFECINHFAERAKRERN